jgi:hypothetical protein
MSHRLFFRLREVFLFATKGIYMTRNDSVSLEI